MLFAAIYCQPHSVSSLLCIRSSVPYIFQGYHCACGSNSCWWFFGNVHCLSTFFDLSVFLFGALSYLFLLDSCREDNFFIQYVFVSGFSEISLAKSSSLCYFLVFPCIVQFLVEMHYKIAAAVLHRHKWHWLAVVVHVVLINILWHRAAFWSTSKWVYIEKLYVFVVKVRYLEFAH